MTPTSDVRGLQPRRLDRLAGLVQARRRGGRRARAARRVLAVVLLLAAAVLAVDRPQKAPSGVSVLAVSRDLTAGSVLGAADLELVSVPRAPDGALTDPGSADGRTLSGAMRKGELLTDARVVPAGGPEPGPGRVAVPIRLADPATATLLQPGVHVAVLVVDEAGSPRRLTADAVVLAVPSAIDPAGGTSRIGVSAGGSGRLAILAVPTRDADRLAAAALTGEIALRFT